MSRSSRRKPAAFRCPACDEALRVRGDAVGRAFDCPSCRVGLLLRRDEDGAVTVRALDETADRATPRWPFALAAIGLACAVAAGWLVWPSDDPPSGDLGPVPPIAVAPAPVVPVAPALPVAVEPVAPLPDAPPMVQPPVSSSPGDPPLVEAPEPPPVRPPVAAPRPGDDVAVRRIERRLAATLSAYQMPVARPLREAVLNVEDLLRTRVTIEANGDVPVRVDQPGPITVRAVLDEMADAAGLRVRVTVKGVRLVPASASGR